MFAVASDLVVAETAKAHPKAEDLANLLAAIMALNSLSRLPASVRDIRAFRVEQWPDFTKIVKS